MSTSVMTVDLAARYIVAAAANKRWGSVTARTKIIAWTTVLSSYHKASNTSPRAAERRTIAAPSAAGARPYAIAERHTTWAHERRHTQAAASAAPLTELTTLRRANRHLHRPNHKQ